MVVKALNVLLLLLMSAALQPLFPAHVYAQTVTILTENIGFSNYLDENGTLVGFNVDIVEEIQRRLNRNDPIKVVPWSRGIALASSDVPNIALFSTVRSKERDPLFKWVGPLNVLRHVLYAKREFGLDTLTIEQAKEVGTIGCMASGIRVSLLRCFGFENLKEVYAEDAVGMLLKMLEMGRVTLISTSPEELYSASLRTGIRFESVKSVLRFDNFFAYIAFSKKTEDQEVARWQAALDEMKADGTYLHIMQSHGVDPGMMAFDDVTVYH